MTILTYFKLLTVLIVVSISFNCKNITKEKTAINNNLDSISKSFKFDNETNSDTLGKYLLDNLPKELLQNNDLEIRMYTNETLPKIIKTHLFILSKKLGIWSIYKVTLQKTYADQGFMKVIDRKIAIKTLDNSACYEIYSKLIDLGILKLKSYDDVTVYPILKKLKNIDKIGYVTFKDIRRVFTIALMNKQNRKIVSIHNPFFYYKKYNIQEIKSWVLILNYLLQFQELEYLSN